jgi:hypothetical protein
LYEVGVKPSPRHEHIRDTSMHQIAENLTPDEAQSPI